MLGVAHITDNIIVVIIMHGGKDYSGIMPTLSEGRCMSVVGTKVLVNVKTSFNFKDEHVVINLKTRIMLSTSVCQTKNLLRNLSRNF